MRAIIYVRTSGEAQVDREGPGIQEDSCRSYATQRGWAVVGVLHEAATTGKTDERPEFAKALVMVEDGEADVILVASMDRLARTLTVSEGLLSRAWSAGAEVHMANYGVVLQDDPDDPMRTFIRQVMGAVAQLDRAMLTARMMAGRRRKKARGGKGEGSYPFGFTKNGPDPDEQATLARIIDLTDTQGLTLERAAEVLNSENLYTRNGLPWSPQNLCKVRRNALRFQSNIEAFSHAA